jgi:hypothetical protein
MEYLTEGLNQGARTRRGIMERSPPPLVWNVWFKPLECSWLVTGLMVVDSLLAVTLRPRWIPI